MARKAYTSEEVAKRMESLPEAAADFLYSSEMNSIIKGISDKNSLHIDQMGLLEAEAGQLILGLTEPQDFAPYIAESLKIDAQKADTIAKDVNEQVMSKIRASMGQPSHAPTTPVTEPISAIPAVSVIPTPSVVMPSSPKAADAPSLTPTTTPVAAPIQAAAAPAAPKPTAAPSLAAADAILSEKKVTAPATAQVSAVPAATPAAPTANPAPKVDPAQPQNYKADPYREPVE